MKKSVTYPPVDIIVPIYNARIEVMKCVTSVILHGAGNYSLVLVDDCSPDQALVRFLEQAEKDHPQIVLLRPETNGGFVQSTNLGMRHSTEVARKTGRKRDVLLLNSDTIVTPEFLERIQACVYADANTGIASPFSNNATICSLPNFCQDNALPSDMPLDDYARIISRVSLKKRPEIVTAIGFCMYVRNEVIQKIGYLDTIYGRGFGEENDYCEQAKASGFTIRLVDDVFIAHTGKASFGDEGRMLEHSNMKILLSRFPSYGEEVAYFCETNPLLEVQANANYFTRTEKTAGYPAALHLIHSNPFLPSAGGSEHYLIDLLRGMKLPRALLAYPSEGGITVSEIIGGDTENPVRFFYPLKSQPAMVGYEHAEAEAALRGVIDSLNVKLVHIHHLFRWPISIWKVFEEKSVPFYYTLHDYYAVSLSHNLFDYSRMRPCELGDESSEECLQAYERISQIPLPGTASDAAKFHLQQFTELLTHAKRVIAPCQKALTLVEERLPVGIRSTVIPHGYDFSKQETRPVQNYSGALKVAVLGNVNYPNKGSENYRELVRGTRNANIEWHFFGELSGFQFENDLKDLGDPKKLFFHGAYSQKSIVSLLHTNEIQLSVIAPACHETFSFTLSETLLAGIPVLALKIGSLEERLSQAQMPESLCETNAQLLERLHFYAAFRSELSRLTTKLRAFRHLSIEESAALLLKSYGEDAAPLHKALKSISLETRREAFPAHLRALRPEGREFVPLMAIDRHRPMWWRPVATRMGRAVQKIDNLLKEQYLRQRIRIVQTFPFRALARLCALSPDTQFIRAQGGAASFRATGTDPFLILPERRVATDDVDCLRLRIRCVTSLRPRAQLFWVHQTGEAFSEAKSLSIPLRKTSGWQDVVLDLRDWSARKRWTSEPEVVMLRLDPLDCEGTFELQDLVLAKFSNHPAN